MIEVWGGSIKKKKGSSSPDILCLELFVYVCSGCVFVLSEVGGGLAFFLAESFKMLKDECNVSSVNFFCV